VRDRGATEVPISRFRDVLRPGFFLSSLLGAKLARAIQHGKGFVRPQSWPNERPRPHWVTLFGLLLLLHLLELTPLLLDFLLLLLDLTLGLLLLILLVLHRVADRESAQCT
jgi:hypothetical protein